MRSWISSLFAASIAVAHGVSARAATIEVPADFPTIQAAIDVSVSGDVVLVAPGTYSGAGNRDLDPGIRNIEIVGAHGPELTFIDCEGSGRALWVHGGQSIDMKLEGFTIRNGLHDGGGVYVENGSFITIRECRFENCQGTGPSGVAAVRGQGDLVDVVFEDCSNLTAIYVLQWRGGRITRCRVEPNEVSPPLAGAILEDLGAQSLLVEDSVFRGRFAGSTLVPSGSGLTVRRCEFISEGAEAPSLYIAFQGSTLAVEECTAVGNVDIDRSTTGSITFDRSILGGGCGEVQGPDFDPVVLVCCAYDPAAASGLIHAFGPQVLEDPGFCAVACSDVGGNHELRSDSPCLPENNICGVQIGAYGEGCAVATTEPDGVEPLDDPTSIKIVSRIPAGDSVRLELPESLQGDVTLQILDCSGRVLASWQVAGNARTVDLSLDRQIGSGTFFLRATDSLGSLATAKLATVRD